jgi:hypothetical protein
VVPRSVNLARILLAVESTVWLGIGLAATVTSVVNQHLGGLVFIGLILSFAGRGVWSAATLGRLTQQPRTAGLILALAGLLLGLALTVPAQGFWPRAILGLLLLAVNGTIIYGLYSAKAQAAFRASAAGVRRTETAPQLVPGAATWAAITLSRGSRVARGIAQFLAWVGAAAGLAFVLLGIGNSSLTGLAGGLALIAVNSVIIFHVTRSRGSRFPAPAAGSRSRAPFPALPVDYPPPSTP